MLVEPAGAYPVASNWVWVWGSTSNEVVGVDGKGGDVLQFPGQRVSWASSSSIAGVALLLADEACVYAGVQIVVQVGRQAGRQGRQWPPKVKKGQIS